MTIDVTPNTVYFATCALLLILQVHQYWMITRVKREINEIWTQLGILLTTLSIKLTQLDNKVDNKTNKDEK